MEFFVIWTITGVIAAAIASSKGRSGVGWFFIGFFFSLIGIVIVACLPNLKEEQEHREHLERENRRVREQLQQERYKNEVFRQHASARLDSHDDRLGIDTRSPNAHLPGDDARHHLEQRHEFSDESEDATFLSDLEDQRDARGRSEYPGTLDDAAYPIGSGEADPPPPPVQNRRREWHYEQHGQVIGPISESELINLVRSGRLSESTLVWAEELGDWKAVRQIKPLRRLLPS